MASPVREVRDFVATLTTFDVRGGFLPDTPNEVVGIINVTGDEPPAETFVGKGRGPKLNIENPNFQIMVRTEPDCYEAAEDEAQSLYLALHNLVGVTLSGTRYSLIEALQPPNNLGLDQQGRRMVGFNIRCWKEAS